MPPRSADRRSAGTDLPGLTGLRFLAAFWVLGFHAMPRTALPRPVAAFWDAGYAGVSLFFVLSGFILAHVYGEAASRGSLSTRAFLAARFARVYPAYAAALIFTLPAFVRSLEVQPAAPTGATLAGVCLSSITMTQAWIPGWGCGWNCPGWSLSAEAFFYLSFPLLAPRLGRMSLGRLAALGFAAYAAALLLGVALADGAEAGRVLSLPFLGGLGLTAWTPLVRLPEFVLGMAAARLLRTSDGTPRVTAGAGLLAAAVIVAVSALPAATLHGLLLWPGLAVPFAVVIAALSSPSGGGLLTTGLFQRLGNASYSLYLIHAVGHGYLLAALNRTWGRGYDERWPVFLLYVPLIVGASLLMHDFLEVPARQRLRLALAGPARDGSVSPGL